MTIWGVPIYALATIQRNLNCGHDKAVKLPAELDTGKDIGLVERVKWGYGHPAKIYAKQFTSTEIPRSQEEPDSQEDPERIRLITKRLYRETVRKFCISPASIERDLRTLIRNCWEQPDRSFLEHVAGRALSKPPTNSKFIDMLAAFL